MLWFVMRTGRGSENKSASVALLPNVRTELGAKISASDKQ